jgi:hypothetical protein
MLVLAPGSRAYNHDRVRTRAKSHNNWCNGTKRSSRRKTIPGATDALAFITYVTQILIPNLWVGACVVMDNLPAHKVNGIREAIEEKGAKIICLSPYSSDFSPLIELLVKG